MLLLYLLDKGLYDPVPYAMYRYSNLALLDKVIDRYITYIDSYIK